MEALGASVPCTSPLRPSGVWEPSRDESEQHPGTDQSESGQPHKIGIRKLSIEIFPNSLCRLGSFWISARWRLGTGLLLTKFLQDGTIVPISKMSTLRL